MPEPLDLRRVLSLLQGQPLGPMNLPPGQPNRPLGLNIPQDVGEAILGLLGITDSLSDPKASKAATLGNLLAAGIPLAALKMPALTEEATQRGIRAYHGSPHDFEKFSMSKIGTGEGAQAYGHGLYFAGAEDTAQYYRDMLQSARRRTEPVMYNGKEIPMGTGLHPLLIDVAERGKAATIADLERSIRFNRTNNYAPDMANLQESYLDMLRGIDESKLSVPKGRMYEVNINASPDQFLDWDKRLQEQSPQVQQALSSIGVSPQGIHWSWQPHRVTANDVAAKTFGPSAKVGDWVAVQLDASGGINFHGGQTYSSREAATKNAAQRQASSDFSPRDTGEYLYRDMASAASKPGAFPELRVPSKEGASERLRAAGIPGLRYLDQGSRAAGEGTHNYVVWDDSLIDILRKYGLLPPLAVGAYGASQQGKP